MDSLRRILLSHTPSTSCNIVFHRVYSCHLFRLHTRACSFYSERGLVRRLVDALHAALCLIDASATSQQKPQAHVASPRAESAEGLRLRAELLEAPLALRTRLFLSHTPLLLQFLELLALPEVRSTNIEQLHILRVILDSELFRLWAADFLRISPHSLAIGVLFTSCSAHRCSVTVWFASSQQRQQQRRQQCL